jgi:hypothetical protein
MRIYTIHILERNVRALNKDKAARLLFLDIKKDFDSLRDIRLIS